MNFTAAGLSDVGLQREHNEDSYCILSEHRLFVVADGMGGHRGGDVASHMATKEITAFFDATSVDGDDVEWPSEENSRLSPDQNRLVSAVKLANQRIFQASVGNSSVQGMGTTVVGAFYARDDQKIHIAHVGDSRAYRIRAGAITQLTRDHSLLNDYLLVMPNLTDAQRERLPSNVITRALGMQDGVAVDVHCEDVEPGDVYVLCSDGLNGMVGDERILDIVHNAGPDVETAAKALIAQANQNGGEDNITVVVVRITE
ncbi:MAG: Stp1/IreP family PP2C-type Ser/Thr phosphatase [Deltaproteobacteria bacterium]|jgi:protein phosphatase|nr:Stp1/IreP family PP2C-type Ser/Thr phosphatase [Deltaproteobacteria bacterium]MBW2210069.1 Stp1/IreP family PP2C-type Ser/Thr phosphatase [Deltaproteobacteria bacterium]MBW2215290.1 Stp1/IreP family PP2C-type Ser/Thr phosphatase [Deltaproteobacteria bacterium]MBW2378180.1 Stp1/IreP family PP2C-type Ser/Thr phosphatase [Deltaproteobacteria bacterium]MBW2626100.1 Stp1/IreP family PP2C-type Ser/Thr phosphatase [Deltaproteobacteria bacterium]